MANLTAFGTSNGRRTISTCSQSSDGNGSISASAFTVDSALTGRLYSRENVYQQWQLLERKPLLSPFERIWVIALRLSFDPMSQVRELAKKLVSYITFEAEEIRKRINETNLVDASKVKFVVGSPTNRVDAEAQVRNNINNQHRIRNSSSGGENNHGMFTSSTFFTPKRWVFFSISPEMN